MKNKIKEVIKRKNISFKYLAKITKLGETTLYSIARSTSIPTIKSAFKISKALNTPVEELFFNDDEKED